MKRILHERARTIIVLVAVAACTGLPPRVDPVATGTGVTVTADPFANPFIVAAPDAADTLGIRVRLMELDAVDADRVRAAPVASAIDVAVAAALLDRLAGPAREPSDPGSFRFPPSSLPAPRPGETTRGVLPGPGDAPPAPTLAASGPLRVLNVSPRGMSARVSQVSVTFSRPMVALSAIEAPTGITLTPNVDGEWRWLDPYTLVLDVVGGLPGATRFTAEVSASLRAADGTVLGEPVRWTFSTPAPGVRNVFVVDEMVSVGRRPSLPILLIEFDQRVDPVAVLPFLRLTVEGDEIPLRALTAEERDSNPMRARLARAPEIGTLAVTTVRPIPLGRVDSTAYPGTYRWNAVLRVLPGMPSLDGPERTAAAAEHSFSIRKGFHVIEHGCGRAFSCRPGVPWTIRFSHAVQSAPDTASWVHIEPELPGATLEVWQNHLVVLGSARAGTNYTVRLDPSIAGSGGGTLGDAPVLRFDVGAPQPMIWMPGGPFTSIPGDAPARYPILVNGADSLHVRVYAVSPADLPLHRVVLSRGLATVPGTELARLRLPVQEGEAGTGEVIVDLTDHLDRVGGHVIIGAWADDLRTSASVWVQRARVLLDIAEDEGGMRVRATSALTGRPLRSVHLEQITAIPGRPRAPLGATTDENGLAALGMTDPQEGEWILRATHDGDTVLVPCWFPADRCRQYWEPAVRAHLLADRPIHAPGDTVRFVTWLRRSDGVGREPAAVEKGTPIPFTVRDARSQILKEDTLIAGASGRIESAFVLPLETNTGQGMMTFRVPGRPHVRTVQLGFSVHEVRRPNFEFSLTYDPGPYTPGSRVEIATRARYFTGGGIPDAELNWHVHSAPTHFAPPGRADYSFGRVRPMAGTWIEPASLRTKTDARGRHRLSIAIDAVNPAQSMALAVQATVTDLDRQPRAERRNILIHPADVFVGLRTPARFARAGEPVIVDAIVVDADGRLVAGRPLTIRAMKQERRDSAGLSLVHETMRAQCARRSSTEPIRCLLDGLPAGNYILVAAVADARGRRSESEHALRVAGEVIPAFAHAVRDTIAVIPDREEYAPGDTAVVLVDASFHASNAVLTVRKFGIIDEIPLRLDNGVATVRVPITDLLVPSAHLHVIAHSGGAWATKTSEIRVTPGPRLLRVTVEPALAALAPGDSTTVRVTVTDDRERPVPDAEVALSAVDEALIALTLQPFRDPMADIYPRSSPGVHDRSLRSGLAPRIETTPHADARDGGTITGVVIDGSTGRPEVGAWVELDGLRGAWSRPDGTWWLDGVAPGLHTLAARAAGHVTSQTAHVDMPLNGNVRTNFVLFTRQAILTAGRTSAELALARQLPLGLSGALALQEVRVEASLVSRFPFTVAASARSTLPAAVTATAAGSPAVEPLRTDFSAVAAFVIDARTGPDGTVEIPVTTPHSVTRYRLRAEVVHGDRRFGTGESTLTARLPLMVRIMAPRFLNTEDRFELPVILENRSGRPLELDVALRAMNASVLGSPGRRITVPSEDRAELQFPVTAGSPGNAVFQIAAAPVGGGPTDAAETTVPIYLPAVTETFAAYGELDDTKPVAYPLRIPTGMIPGQTNLDLGFSTTAVHGLYDAWRFLWQCIWIDLPEVHASRILALSALRTLPAVDWMDRGLIDLVMARDIRALARHQLRDGGWSFFAARFDADPFLSVHVAHALARAREAGVAVPERTLADATRWLERNDPYIPDSVARRLGFQSAFAPDYPLQAKHAVQAYAYDVRRRLGHDVSASAARLLTDVGANALPAEALAWLLPALASNPQFAAQADDVRRELAGLLVRSAGTAGFVSPYDAGGQRMLYSPRRTDAVVLAALLEHGSSPEVIAAIARGLMAHRVRGHWANTQENAYAVVALADYLARAEATEPDFVARAWAGERLAGERGFPGRSDERHEIIIPADSLGSPGSEADLIVAREGAGRLYYRVGLSYARAIPSPPLAHGFEVSRTYEAVDDSADVRRDADGTWRIRRGARVRVHVTVANAGPRYHVAVVDPLPAGFEAVNAQLVGNAGMMPPRSGTVARSGIEPFYAEHSNARDERFEVFRTRLEPGRREITYLAIATTPGEFAAPAPRAEEMYSPETFGRGAGERVVIEVTPAR